MKLRFHQTGGAGWVLLAVVIFGWDIVAPETMSAAFRRATATPAGRVAVTAGWTVLTAHLFDVLPLGKDPVQLALACVRRRQGDVHYLCGEGI